MKRTASWTAALCLAIAQVTAAEPTVFVDDHLDLEITYAEEEREHPLSLEIFSDDLEQAFALSNVVIQVAEGARLTLPAGTPFGDEGESVWVLPQSQSQGVVLLGLATDELPDIFSVSPSIRLVAVEGPGEFYLWQIDQAGVLDIRMNSRDGIDENDQITPAPGSHEHANWGFGSNGIYRVTFAVSARRSGDSTNITSEPLTAVFHVLPLPESPFANWQAEHFGGNMADAAPDADPDADQVPNLLEYAFDSDPNETGRNGFAQAVRVTENGQSYFELEFSRNSAATDLTFSVQAADSVPAAEWETIHTGSVAGPGGTARVIRVRDSRPMDGAGARFYRLRVDLQSD